MFGWLKKKVVAVGLVAVSLIAPSMAEDAVISLPALDLSSLTTWIVGIGGTLIAISGTMYAIKRAQRFLGG